MASQQISVCTCIFLALSHLVVALLYGLFPTPEKAKLFSSYYGMAPQGNFDEKNVLAVPQPLVDVAKEHGLTREQAQTQLHEVRIALLAVRQQRVPPHKDTKIITAWNGLMISAFARAVPVFNEPEYAQHAQRAAEFLLGKMRCGGRLSRRALDGVATGTVYLEITRLLRLSSSTCTR